ncbi:hypothetical protein [Agrococcus sp. ARC_14]|uniref:hypothetical protein n=1 Tax=Agrococcus sp. ARC_14 TaxID=2919927 RepID=UPI001F0535F2|nr:hypothetical protein [Agrococcus sp. ARC_14]MCH1881833.1 hypothetical protein [Agrococcus sp. ARC_14]
MRLGSGEHYGWAQPRTVELVEVVDGAGEHAHGLAGEFARLHVPVGVQGGPLTVMVRPRTGRAEAWRAPAPGTRIEVQAWQLSDAAAHRLDASAERGETEPWSPPQRNPHLWLWVEG